MAHKDDTARRLMSIPRLRPNHGLADGGERSGCQQRRAARICSLSRANAQAKLIGRQAEARAQFENGQSIPAIDTRASCSRSAHGLAAGHGRQIPATPGWTHFLTIDDRVELLVVANIRP
jgi:hypothetical protein